MKNIWRMVIRIYMLISGLKGLRIWEINPFFNEYMYRYLHHSIFSFEMLISKIYYILHLLIYHLKLPGILKKKKDFSSQGLKISLTCGI